MLQPRTIFDYARVNFGCSHTLRKPLIFLGLKVECMLIQVKSYVHSEFQPHRLRGFCMKV